MNDSIKKIGLIFKWHDERVPKIVNDIIPWLQARDVEVFIDETTAKQFPVRTSVVPTDELAGNVDVIGVFGGDGTLLHATRLVGSTGVPIIGINLGSLGFLTKYKIEEMHAAFDDLLTGQYQLQERMLLDVEVIKTGKTVARYRALNDAVINKGALARIIDLEISVNSQPMLLTRADGLIISTPTGSTAYSLAAGGPILYPTLDAILIAPICPHALTNRPVVIPNRDVVEVCLRRGNDVMLTVDGQVGMPLLEQDSLKISRAESVMRLVLPSDSTFFNLLREKLRWG
ncbi:MAG: NAD(+)/NADH kinase [Acidobacteria bacterium]|nr:NAD(+)/NADH kinase [Acidobacteriota bacterium]